MNLAPIDAALALNTREGRKLAYDLVMQAMSTMDVPGLTPEGAALFRRLGDMYAQTGNFVTALRAWSDAMACPGALGDVQLHLRLGKASLELGDESRAADELCRAFMGGGREVFEGEDPKYFAFLKTKILPPSGQAW